ncbi:hypothetical protein Tco_1414052, partial [Tanacetum coccineum]
AVVSKEQVVKPSIFSADSALAGGTDPAMGGFTDLTSSYLLVGGIRTIVNTNYDIQKVYVPQWSVTNGSRLDDGGVCHGMVDEFAPLKFFASMALSAKVRMCAEYNIKERRRLNFVVEEKNSLLKAKDEEVESLKAQLLVKEAEATEAVRLRAEASKFEVIKKSLVKKQEVADLDAMVTSVKLQNDNLADQVHKLEASSVGLQEKVTVYEECMSHLEKFQDEKMKELLTHGMELALTKCLNSTEYLSALGAAISKAVEKGMQKGLSARITHGAEGRKLTDVAAYNPSAEADYLSALQRLQSVNFSLIAELRANKDASVDTIMNLLCLEDTLAERLGLAGSQPHVNQLMVPIHHSLDQRVIGASALSLSLDVSSSQPLSAVALEGMIGTSNAAPCTADTTTALSIVSSASTVRPISIDDYEVISADNQATVDRNVADEDANPFPNVDDTELNVPE